MQPKTLALFPILALAVCSDASAQIYDTSNDVVGTFAGSGFFGLVNGQGTLTMFNGPSEIVADSSSNLFVWDSTNLVIRKITPAGAVSTFAGGGSSSEGLGTNVSFTLYPGIGPMAIDHSNNIWIAASSSSYNYSTDTYSNSTSLLSISPLGYVVLEMDGLPVAPSLNGMCFDSTNNLYLSYAAGNQIYRYHPSTGFLEVFAGSGNPGSSNGNGIFTSFFTPGPLAADASDNIYVWDSGNQEIRRINQNRDVVTVTSPSSFQGSLVSLDGSNPSFSSISSMCFDSFGNLILACGSAVRKLSFPTYAVTLAGTLSTTNTITVHGTTTIEFFPGATGYTNGPGNVALFKGAAGACVSGGVVFVADSGNERIRSIASSQQPEVVLSAILGISTYSGLTITGVVGTTYQIQSSPDMTTWTTVATFLLNSSPFLWFDQNPIAGNKFYRALLLP